MEIRYFMKKRNKNDKNTILFWWKAKRNVKKVYEKHKVKIKSSILYCELAPLTVDIIAQNFRDIEKM